MWKKCFYSEKKVWILTLIPKPIFPFRRLKMKCRVCIYFGVQMGRRPWMRLVFLYLPRRCKNTRKTLRVVIHQPGNSKLPSHCCGSISRSMRCIPPEMSVPLWWLAVFPVGRSVAGSSWLGPRVCSVIGVKYSPVMTAWGEIPILEQVQLKLEYPKRSGFSFWRNVTYLQFLLGYSLPYAQ